jgi:hypothetical protein
MPVVGRLNQYGSMLVTEFDETTANGPSITGLGTYYASEFSENVGIETTITANVFAPYDVVYDEFAGVLYGPGQGRYMRQNTDKSVIVYNEIDEIDLNPSCAIVPSTTSVNEGSSVIFNVISTNVENGTTLYYDITGSAGISTSDFTNSSLSGSLVISGDFNLGFGSTTLTLANDVTTEGTETFNMNLRTGSISGPIVTSSQLITINDTSFVPSLYDFTSFTFTNGTATGRNGPTSFATQSNYTSQSWYSTYFSVSSGIQNWTAPATGNYTIRAAGAAGQNGNFATYCRGIIIESTISLVEGQQYKILIGQKGSVYVTSSGGGGGGTFMTTTANSPIIVAGGGGGAVSNSATFYSGSDGQSGTSGANSSEGYGTGGTSGNGGTGAVGGSGSRWGGGGGGLLTNGTNAASNGTGELGFAFVNGGQGGNSGGTAIAFGGFGGGAGTHGNAGGGGGGGGYSGGGGSGENIANTTAGGGGSYSLSSISVIGYNTGHGYLIITKL